MRWLPWLIGLVAVAQYGVIVMMAPTDYVSTDMAYLVMWLLLIAAGAAWYCGCSWGGYCGYGGCGCGHCEGCSGGDCCGHCGCEGERSHEHGHEGHEGHAHP